MFRSSKMFANIGDLTSKVISSEKTLPLSHEHSMVATINAKSSQTWFTLYIKPCLSSQWRLLEGLLEGLLGGFFWISFMQLRLLRRASHWKLIQKKHFKRLHSLKRQGLSLWVYHWLVFSQKILLIWKQKTIIILCLFSE